MSTQNDPLNTISIQQFIQQVKAAENSRSKEIKLEINAAKNLAFTLGIVMARLSGDLENILKKNNSNENEVIQINMDGGNKW